MTKSTYNVGGVGGLGLDSRLEIDVEPTRNWKLSKLMRAKVTVYGNKIDNYAVTYEKIAKSADFKLDKEKGTAKNTVENGAALYQLAIDAAYGIVDKLGLTAGAECHPPEDIRDFIEKNLETTVGIESYGSPVFFPPNLADKDTTVVKAKRA